MRGRNNNILCCQEHRFYFPYHRVQVLRAKTGLIINSPGTTHLLPVCFRLAIFFLFKTFCPFTSRPRSNCRSPVTNVRASFRYKHAGRILLQVCRPVFVISMLAGFLNCSGTGSVLP